MARLDSEAVYNKTVLILKKCIRNNYDLKGNICTELHKQIFSKQANNVSLMISSVKWL